MPYFRPIRPPPTRKPDTLGYTRRNAPQRRRITTADWWRIAFGRNHPRPAPGSLASNIMAGLNPRKELSYEAKMQRWYARTQARLAARMPGMRTTQQQFLPRYGTPPNTYSQQSTPQLRQSRRLRRIR